MMGRGRKLLIFLHASVCKYYFCSDTTSSLEDIPLDDICRELGLENSSVRDEWLRDYYLYEQGVSPPKIYNNLKSAYGFWREVLKAPQDILDIIDVGYKIPFLAPPPRYEC